MSEFAKQVLPVALESEKRESYLAYAMSVNVGRASRSKRWAQTGSSSCFIRNECAIKRLQ
ncbi:MAG: hypothetical protein CM1200mP40_18070 [Gammaproteobacteria bacterium]|nr:MAG: hypothetical protein CM1200mP40_18070 [Gammaproteobacteria bacterium]